MKTPVFWKAPASFFSYLLWPLSLVYLLGHRIQTLLVTPKKAPIPILCVGNVVIGGSGKTPTCLALYDLLKKDNTSIHFLTRGYGGTCQGPIQVDLTQHTFKDVGDEALILAQKGPTWVSKNRHAGAMAAYAAGADLIIMDDGFQNRTLKKDLSLLVIDGSYQFGNGFLLPAGPLREPLEEAFSRAQAILCIGDNIDHPSRLPIFHASIKAKALNPSITYVAFAGIGHPEKFFKTLEDLQLNVVMEIPFPDHHPYTLRDLKNLKEMATLHKAHLLTTEKDFVRLPSDIQKDVLALPVTLTFSKADMLRSFITNSLFCTRSPSD